MTTSAAPAPRVPPYEQERPIARLTALHLLDGWDRTRTHLDTLGAEFVGLHPRFQGLWIDMTRNRRKKARR